MQWVSEIMLHPVAKFDTHSWNYSIVIASRTEINNIFHLVAFSFYDS